MKKSILRFAVLASLLCLQLSDRGGDMRVDDVSGSLLYPTNFWSNTNNLAALQTALLAAGLAPGGGTSGTATNLDGGATNQVNALALAQAQLVVATNGGNTNALTGAQQAILSAALTNNQTGNVSLQGALAAGSLTAGGIAVVVATNYGVTDPLALAYAASNGITDPLAVGRLDRFCKRIRTMAAFTNLQDQFLFSPAYNPTNNRDLFGNAIAWKGEPAFNWGATCVFTNQGKFAVASTTNWTIIMVKRNYNAGDVPLGWYNECSAENTNGDSFNWVWAHITRGGFQFVPTYGGALSMGSNVASSALLQLGSNGGNTCTEVPPSVWAFEAKGGASVWGSVDTLPMYTSAIATNLMNNPAVGLTNWSPVQVVTVGGSTNWNSVWEHNLFASSDKPTNALCEIYSVAFFNTAISTNDLYTYYAAIAETYPSQRHWVQLGDSMMAGGNNFITPYAAGAPATNFVLFQFAQKHPNDMWHDWAQGGTVLSGFTNNLPPRLLTLLPASADVTVITDFPRNDADQTNAINVSALDAIAASALAPWLATGAKCWLYESPLPATNVTFNGSGYLPAARTNLYTAYKLLETNSIFNRVLHGMDYFSGSVWDTNNGYYGYSMAGFDNPGYHIEGTNSPLFMVQMATYWDTGEWPAAMPTIDPTQGGYPPQAAIVTGGSATNAVALTNGTATVLTVVSNPASGNTALTVSGNLVVNGTISGELSSSSGCAWETNDETAGASLVNSSYLTVTVPAGNYYILANVVMYTTNNDGLRIGMNLSPAANHPWLGNFATANPGGSSVLGGSLGWPPASASSISGVNNVAFVNNQTGQAFLYGMFQATNTTTITLTLQSANSDTVTIKNGSYLYVMAASGGGGVGNGGGGGMSGTATNLDGAATNQVIGLIGVYGSSPTSGITALTATGIVQSLTATVPYATNSGTAATAAYATNAATALALSGAATNQVNALALAQAQLVAATNISSSMSGWAWETNDETAGASLVNSTYLTVTVPAGNYYLLANAVMFTTNNDGIHIGITTSPAANHLWLGNFSATFESEGSWGGGYGWVPASASSLSDANNVVWLNNTTGQAFLYGMFQATNTTTITLQWQSANSDTVTIKNGSCLYVMAASGGGGGGGGTSGTATNLDGGATNQVNALALAQAQAVGATNVAGLAGNLQTVNTNNINTNNASQLSSGTVAPSLLPLATSSAYGAVKPDGTTITIAGGVISSSGSSGTATNLTGAATNQVNVLALAQAQTVGATNVAGLAGNLQTVNTNNINTNNASQLTSGTVAPSLLPLATTSAYGAVKPDGTTITIAGGVISTAAGGGGVILAQVTNSIGGINTNVLIISGFGAPSVNGTWTNVGLVELNGLYPRFVYTNMADNGVFMWSATNSSSIQWDIGTNVAAQAWYGQSTAFANQAPTNTMTWNSSGGAPDTLGTVTWQTTSGGTGTNAISTGYAFLVGRTNTTVTLSGNTVYFDSTGTATGAVANGSANNTFQTNVTTVNGTNYLANPYATASAGIPRLWLGQTTASDGTVIPLLTINQEYGTPNVSAVISSWSYDPLDACYNAGRFVGESYNWYLASPSSDTRSGILKFWAYNNMNDGGGVILETHASSASGASGSAFGKHGTFCNPLYSGHMGTLAVGNLTDAADPGNTPSPLDSYTTNGWLNIFGDGSAWSVAQGGSAISQLVPLRILPQKLVAAPVPGGVELDGTNAYFTDLNSTRWRMVKGDTNGNAFATSMLATNGIISPQASASAFQWSAIPAFSSTATNYWIGTWTNGTYCCIWSNTSSSYAIKQLAP